MTSTVEIPLWLLVLILLFAAITFASHFLFPSVRWFFRGRVERAIARLNQRLERPIEPFKLMRRQDKIVRLIYDPAVIQAVVDHARETGVPESVSFEAAKRYAREIVPGFSTLLYFGVAIRLARWLSKLLYRVRIGRIDAALNGLDPEATVIFVINHRSNMDYVLVTWLVAQRSAMSYAVGEWARVWPLSRLIRAMGAYFIRRNSGNPLYRRVLARYVQMATAEGTTQAVFPEGGLSPDGRVGAARMGLLHYIVSGFNPAGRDVVFVPVGLCYDRVLEDRLLTEAGKSGKRRFRAKPVTIARFIARMLWRKLRGRFAGFGTAAVGFGPPVSLRHWLETAPDRTTEALGADLMARIAQSVPVIPVPLVASVMMEGPVAEADLPAKLEDLMARMKDEGRALRVPEISKLIEQGLRPLVARGVLAQTPAGLAVVPGQEPLLAFYAATVLQSIDMHSATAS
ncbi:MAG: 1-acyl-sn-glycerol-3-phosphate acyltransferase [Pseudorhodobacter sp.]|nr:1-acyl-sn-glycerol-3-phosphate acyltransferase [Pseudorhodobacter sp.]